MFYFDASKMKKVLKFFKDRHRFFILTDDTVVHKYNIHNHIAREYGHQLGRNLNVSTVLVFHGSRTVFPPRFPWNKLDEPEKKTRINQTETEINTQKTKHNDDGILFYKKSQLSTLIQLSAVLFSLNTKLMPITLHMVTASGMSLIIITCFIILSLFNSVLTFKIAFTSSALIQLFNSKFTTFIWLNTRSISALECGIGYMTCVEQNQPVFCMEFHQWYLHTSIFQSTMLLCQ